MVEIRCADGGRAFGFDSGGWHQHEVAYGDERRTEGCQKRALGPRRGEVLNDIFTERQIRTSTEPLRRRGKGVPVVEAMPTVAVQCSGNRRTGASPRRHYGQTALLHWVGRAPASDVIWASLACHALAMLSGVVEGDDVDRGRCHRGECLCER